MSPGGGTGAPQGVTLPDEPHGYTVNVCVVITMWPNINLIIKIRTITKTNTLRPLNRIHHINVEVVQNKHSTKQKKYK
jgi:hypothetical protein